MKIGYARTSTVEQTYSLEDQVSQLEQLGCERIYSEHASAAGQRDEFQKMLDFCREGDCIYVTKLDRSFRDTQQALTTAQLLHDKKVGLILQDLGGVDVTSPMGKVVFTCMSAFAQFERERLKERQAIGISKAQNDGKYKGRKKSIDRELVLRLKEEGEGVIAIAKQAGCSRMSVNRILKETNP